MLIRNMVTALLAGLLAFPAFSQDQKIIDSLTSLLHYQKSAAEKFSILFDLTFEYIHKDNKQALDLILEAEREALLAGDSLAIVKSKRVKAQLLYFFEKTYQAHTVFSEVLPIAVSNGFDHEVLYIDLMLGKLFLFHGKYDSALELNFKAFSLANKLADDDGRREALHNIGISYYKLKDYRKGLDYLLKGLSYDKGKPSQSFHILSDIGLCYFYLNDFSNARFFVEKGLRDCGPECPDRARINVEYALGLISRAEKQRVLAEKHFLESYHLAKMCNDTRFQFDNIYLLSQIYMEQKQFKKAEFYLVEAEKLIRPSTPFNLEKIKIYSQFAELYRATKSHEKTSHYQYKYIQLKDSIYNEELTNSLMRTEAEFLERENKAKILAQQEVIALKEEIIHRKTIVNLLTVAVGIIVLSLLITALKSYRDKKNMNILLDQKVEERTRELQVIRNELLHTLGERDAKISQTLSDINQTVNSIKGLCYLGMKDVSEPVALSYMHRIDKVTRRLGK